MIINTMDLDRLKLLASIKESKNVDYYFNDIESATADNKSYRKVVYTGKSIQLVLMSIPPGEEIGAETHKNVDQFIRIESGKGMFVISGEEKAAGDGDAVVIPQGTKHNLINIGDDDLKIYAIYSPPEHVQGLEQRNKS